MIKFNVLNLVLYSVFSVALSALCGYMIYRYSGSKVGFALITISGQQIAFGLARYVFKK